MEDPDTDTLRKLAPCWTLAGDERLLTILQNTHQRLVSKCQETNSQLERMATALDDASVSLQNVNNQFMALSSSQFIERRVYDDDIDVAAEVPPTKESPKLSAPDELSMLKRSIAVIESAHEVITILHDSDTESDTDDDLPNRLVMKPKDVYADRPLPYIIGSEPWKSKWHAGLMPEDSDSDSSTSKVDRESDQYSQSEPEDFDLGTQVQDMSTIQRTRKLSESSSEFPSEPTPPTRPSPADVASEIARRLGGGDIPPKMVDQEPQYSTPVKPVVRTVYKPQEPVASTVFPDEPPPLDSPTDSDSDIFASLHRKQPYEHPYARPPQDLFGGSDSEGEGGDIFSDFANQPSAPKPVSLFEAGPTPHMFDKQRQTSEQPRVERPDRTEQPARSTADADDNVRGVKKPVGGISLFGSNSGTENIGAAILQRNRRKSGSSEESGNESQPHTSPIKEQQAKREKDIFDDLFAKSESKKVTPKGIVKDIEERNKKKQETVKKDTPKPVDLFSDNLFDDIDDIFTDVVKSSKDKKKSIFEDDDNLFSEIADTKTEKPKSKKEGLFDSDDDLFSENIPKKETDRSNKTQSITDTSSNPTEISEQPRKNNDVASKITKVSEKPINAEPPNIAKGTASIFDDDDEEDDIFSNIKTKKETPRENVSSTKIVPKIVDTKKNIFNSPSLFGDDDDESDLFTEASKFPDKRQKDVTVNKVSIETLSVKSKNDEDLSKKDTAVANEATIKTSNAPSARHPEMKEDIHIPATRSNVPNEMSNETKITESTTSRVANNIKEEIVSDNNVHRESNNEALTTIGSKSSDENKSSQKEGIFESKNYENASKNVSADDSVNSSDIKTAPIQERLDDDSHTNKNLNNQIFNEEFIQETKSVETSNNSTNEIINNDFDINVPDVNEQEAVINTDNIIQDNSSEKDIFASPINPPSFEIPTNNHAEIDDDINKIPKSDIFADIVSEPPDFEKPKEAKKSKNVNALFDDDSDDETLFFKREDVITDEKPEDFTVQQDRLFDLFTNEPPDEDFTQNDLDDDLFRTLPKPKLPSEINADLDVPVPNDTDDDDDDRLNNKFATEAQIRPEYPKPPIPERKQNTKAIFITNTESDTSVPITDVDSIFYDTDSMITQPASFITTVQDKQMYDDDDELFKSLPVNMPDSRMKSVSRNHDLFYKTDEELFRSLPHNINAIETHKEIQPVLNKNEGFKLPTEMSDSSDAKSEKAGVKKLGKLKVGLNINVNALLPGASPKKVKPVDNTDGQTQSQVEIQKEVPQLPKLVSFDGEPESKVLDNKLSKERPRIQVKRRPSSRKARKEAVRKSGIDFGEDSTDNSSSIDDPPKTEAKVIKNTDNVSNNEVVHISDEDSRSKEENSQDSEDIKPTESEELNLKHETPINISSKTEISTDILADPIKIEPEIRPVKSDSTTKIVYILNDEDIFNTNAIENPEPKTEIFSNLNKESTTKNTENIESNDTNTENSEPIIKTLGNTYKPIKSNDKKKSKSLFGDEQESDDDEIFKSKKPTAKTVIFDSDSEGELFGTSKKEKRVEKVLVKGSLFGDDEDNADDLFGVKTTKHSVPQQPSKSTSTTKEPPKTTQALFEDPLSLFGDDV